MLKSIKQNTAEDHHHMQVDCSELMPALSEMNITTVIKSSCRDQEFLYKNVC